MDENAKKESRELPEWTIPVTWEMCGKVKVRAATIEEAMEIAKDEEGVIPLPMMAITSTAVGSSLTVMLRK